MRGCVFLFLLAAGCRPVSGPVSISDTSAVTTYRGDSLLIGSSSLERRSFVLPDSTKVILNPGTRVYYSRSAVLLDGDAFFDAPHLFTVHTRNLSMTGVAAFRVSAFAKDEGESASILSGRLLATKAYTSHDPETDTLMGGNMVMINRSIDLMEKETFDTLPLRAWVAGSLVFNNAPFDSVVHQLEDWYGVTIDVQGDVGRTARITGTFSSSLKQAMEALALLLPCRYSIARYSVTILPV
ncbi:MAG TPA: FecR domain-containing protein [Dinghuibacter sp.]|jgi:ferric-dicitrate binding protein FerR (iron transport regulator)|uniref:FecR family protein n=1 Tax=Dinghuibacter sp. TaxID=2024697 RepID=UPI002B8FDFEF|nr:FecR domain-containing protein [Dinghuibacter sp.]HTJ15098.1 FecR domain-containing protein [Dinghuibacter sp.]